MPGRGKSILQGCDYTRNQPLVLQDNQRAFADF